MGWDAVLASRKSSPEFEEEYVQTRKIEKKELERPFFPQNIGHSTSFGYRVEKQVEFLSEAEFETKYMCKPRDCGLATTSLVAESGEKVTGVLVDGGAPRVVLLTSIVTANSNTHLLDPEAHVREAQAGEVLNWYRQGGGDGGGKPLKPLSRDHIQSRVHEAMKKRKEAELLRAQAVQEEQSTPAPPPVPAEEEEEEEEVVSAGAPNLFAKPGHGGKSRGKKQDRARENKGHKSTSSVKGPRSSASRTTVACSIDSASVADSHTSSDSKKSGKKEKGESKEELLNRYKKELDAATILTHRDEKPSGRAMWQSQASLAAWVRHSPSGVETICLKGLVSLAKQAVELTTLRIKKLTRKDREAYVKDLLRHGVHFPAEVQSSLTLLRVKEQKLCSEADVPIVVSYIFPLSGPGKFDPLKPLLSETDMTDQQKCMVLQSACVDCLIRLLQGGEEQAQVTIAWSTAVVDAVRDLSALTGILDVAVKEVLCICRCVLALLHPDVHACGATIADVDEVMSSSVGSKMVIREALRVYSSECLAKYTGRT